MFLTKIFCQTDQDPYQTSQTERHYPWLWLTEYAWSDYGVYKLICHAIDQLLKEVILKFHKVKSHQDNNESSVEMLPFQAQLNIQADAYAVWIRKQVGVQSRAPVYITEGMVVQDNSGLKVKDIFKHIKQIIRGQETQAYLIQKHNWTIKTFGMIEWEGLEIYLTKLPMHKRISRLQMIHDWQNVRRQKRKIAKSKQWYKDARNYLDAQQALIEEGIKLDSSCPFQCGEEESHLHFMMCKAPMAIAMQTQILKSTTKTLLKVGVKKTIMRLLVQAVRWTQGNNIPTFIHMGRTLEILIERARKSQTEICWEKVKQGFISTDWIKAQVYYMDKTKQVHKDWKSIMVSWMIEAS